MFDLPLKEMRSSVQEIFQYAPNDKQVMMFSATLSREMRCLCKKFMRDVRNKLAKILFYFFYLLF